MQKITDSLIAKFRLVFALGVIGSLGCPQPASARQFRPLIINSEAHLGQLLYNIHSPQDAYDIRVKYFVWGKGASLPVEQGIKVLDAAIQAETTRSSKLIWLKSIRASVSFDLPEQNLNDGYGAYNDIFNIPKNIDENEKIAVLDSIGSYVNSIPYKLDKMGLQGDSRTRDTLLKAWQAYVHIDPSAVNYESDELNPNLDRNFDKYALREPNFIPAFWEIGHSKQVQDAVTQSLADPTVARTYDVLTVAASVVIQDKPEQATKWLLEAKELIPAKVEGDNKWASLTWQLYNELRISLEAQQQWQQAIFYQRECIARLGGGRGELWVLLGKVGDEAGQKVLVEELKKPGIYPSEVLRAAKLMADNPVKRTATNAQSPAPTADIEILRAFLATSRPSPDYYRLDARVLLAKSLKNNGQLEAALAVAQNDKPADSPFFDEGSWNELGKLREAIVQEINKAT